MKKIIFRGAGTALVTPMKDKDIDYDSLSRLIDMQIEERIDAIIIGGTTGESATLSSYEREKLFAFCKEKVGGRVKLMLGVGSNDTEDVIRRVCVANRLSPDGLLVVTPYYNKGTHGGLIEHYKKIADASNSPIMLYNVPSRTGVSLTLEEIGTLSDEENIVAIKEADDSAKRLTQIASLYPKIALYAGCDTQTFSVLSQGGLGVISVISNLIPSRVHKLCASYFRGDIKGAREEQLKLLPLIESMFTECNPAPVKYALSLLGLCENSLRLPLSSVSEESKRKIERVLSEYK